MRSTGHPQQRIIEKQWQTIRRNNLKPHPLLIGDHRVVPQGILTGEIIPPVMNTDPIAVDLAQLNHVGCGRSSNLHAA
jgi:hypothetical protein